MKNKLLSSILIATAILIQSFQSYSQWTLDYTFSYSSISIRSISIVDSNYIWFSTIDSGLYSHLYKKINNSINTINLPHQLRASRLVSQDTSRLYLYSSIENRLLFTSNSGNNWAVRLDSAPNGSPIYFAIANNDPQFIVATSVQITDSSMSMFYSSTNGGITWQTQQLNLTADNEVYSLSINDKLHIRIGLICYNNCTELKYLFSDNGGTSWQTRSFPLIADNNTIVAPVFSKDNLRGITFSEGYDYYSYTSSNGGSNWSVPAIFSTGGTFYVVSLFNIDSTTIWICAGNDKILKSTNDGVSWSIMNIPLESQDRINSMDILKVGNRYVGFASTYFGKIYKLSESISPIGINQISTEVPEAFTLQQNYPNPFNPLTKVKFSVPNAGNVRISVYDALGKEISLLVNESLRAGVYETDFDAADLPSGVYFYKMNSGNFSETKKMVVLK